MENHKTNSEFMQVQVAVNHYDFDKYVNLERWTSYWHQIVETMSFAPKTVLITGSGDNIVGKMLSAQAIKVYTFDFDKDLHPDFVGNIIDIDSIINKALIAGNLTTGGGGKFDVILCCQLLEHLPYNMFEDILQKLSRLTDNMIISLPNDALNFRIDIKLPRMKCKRINIDIYRFYKKLKFRGEHYWEIGMKGYPQRKIIKSIEKYFIIKKKYLATHNHYHLFFVLTKK
jgi:hypothetical protein